MAKKIYCEIKYCELCGGVFGKPEKGYTKKRWEKRKYCSVECGNKTPWNKGLNGITTSRKGWRKHNYTEIKWCECCDKVFPRNRKFSQKQWDETKYCGTDCRSEKMWNRGLTKETDERLAKLSEFFTGKKTNRPPWSKGLTKHTDERLARMSILTTQRMTGIKPNENQLAALELGRAWGNGLTKETHPSIARRAKILSEKYTGVKRPEQSERQKQYYQDHPEKHPNAILAKKTKGKGYTHIEKIVYELLQELGIEANFNHKIGSKWVDFAIIEKRKVVEADGERWHRDKKKEQERDLYLAQCGWDVLHLTGSEIVSKTDECRERIFEFVAQGQNDYTYEYIY